MMKGAVSIKVRCQVPAARSPAGVFGWNGGFGDGTAEVSLGHSGL